MTPDEVRDQWNAHLREHKLMSEAHSREHVQLAEELKETAREFSEQMRQTAERLADNLRVTAETHWKNHEREHLLAERAIDKAAESVKERQDLTDKTVEHNKSEGNEWRGAMNDKDQKYATKSDAQANEKNINELQRWRAAVEGKTQGMQPMVAIGMAVITAVIVAVAVAFVTRGSP